MNDYVCIECGISIDLVDAYNHRRQGHNVEALFMMEKSRRSAFQPAVQPEPPLIEAEPLSGDPAECVEGHSFLLSMFLGDLLRHHYNVQRGWDSTKSLESFERLLILV